MPTLQLVSVLVIFSGTTLTALYLTQKLCCNFLSSSSTPCNVSIRTRCVHYVLLSKLLCNFSKICLVNLVGLLFLLC